MKFYLPALCLGLFCISCGTLVPAYAEEFRSIAEGLRSLAPNLPECPVAVGKEKPQLFQENLTDHVFTVAGKTYSGFKFHAPVAPDLDMVWSFRVPPGWDAWYIVPQEGKMTGFRDFHRIVKLFKEFPGADKPRPFLQALDAANLVPGKEYYIWFRTEADQPGSAFTAAMKFVPHRQSPWKGVTIAQALQLEAAPAEEQITLLRSTGGKILLDPEFFDAAYAKQRIDRMMVEKDKVDKSAPGAHYNIPADPSGACAGAPSLVRIKEKYGEPKFLITADQRAAAGAELTAEEKRQDVAVYDYFGFAYTPADPQEKVRAVEISPFNADQILHKKDGLFFDETVLARMHIRFFFKDQQEVGRVANWGDHGAKLLTQEPPAGQYLRSGRSEELTYEGDGHWTYHSTFANGSTQWEMGANNYAWNGAAVLYYPNGNKRSEMTYQDGWVSGHIYDWDEQGNLTGHHYFEKGKEVPEKN